MDYRIKNRWALVGGASKGLGLGCARALAREGAHVVLTDLDRVAIDARVAALDGGPHLGQVLDVSDEAQWETALDAVLERFGRIDILVNNAGIPAQGGIEDTTIEHWRRVMAINLDGPFLGCKHAVRRMKSTGGGSIVNVSSVGALKGSLVGPAYGASKAGVWNLTKTVALSCARANYNIRCNSLHPGLTHTPMMDQAPAATLDRLKAGIPMQRLGEPLDIAQAALYLASDESRYTTGTALVVDGGYTI